MGGGCRSRVEGRRYYTAHSLEQAKDESVEAHGVTGEFWELADLVVEAV